MENNHYKQFEEKYRGSRELIKSRLQNYLQLRKLQAEGPTRRFKALGKKILTKAVRSAANFVKRHPRIKAKTKSWLQSHPRLDCRIQRCIRWYKPVAPQPSSGENLTLLSPRARRIYRDLKSTVDSLQKEHR